MKTKGRHTPSPWKKEKFSSYDWWIKKPTGGVICNLTTGSGEQLEECEANANLIAAAPKLLNLVKEFIRHADTEPFTAIGHLIEHGVGTDVARQIVDEAENGYEK